MFRKERKGWLGIDIGTASVKVAQLARNGKEVRVLTTALVPRSAQMPPEGAELIDSLWSSKGEIRAAIAIGGGFRGRHAAAVMPMGFCDMHQLSALAIDEASIDQDVRTAIETITQCSADHLEFDIWPTDFANQQRWNVLAVARPWADRIYSDVVDNGYACHTIDGVPHALARAIELSAGGPMPPTAVVDWGFSQATFCVVANGEPAYVRVLKECSFETVLSEVASELDVSLDEAGLLLAKFGARGLNFKTDDEIVTMVADLIAEPLRHLMEELTRTLTHVSSQCRDLRPRTLVLFGGGSLVGGLSRYLTRKLHLETQVWAIAGHDPAVVRHDSLFGIAMALSALAWKED